MMVQSALGIAKNKPDLIDRAEPVDGIPVNYCTFRIRVSQPCGSTRMRAWLVLRVSP